MVGDLGVAHENQTVDGNHVQDRENLSHRKLVKGHEEYEEHEEKEEKEIDDKEEMEEAQHDDNFLEEQED